MFEETIHDIDRVPKDLVREYETPTGAKESIIIRQDFFNDFFQVQTYSSLKYECLTLVVCFWTIFQQRS